MSTTTPYTVVFFGSSPFSGRILEALLQDERYVIVAVVCAPDKPSGRKQILQESVTAHIATQAGIPAHKFESLRSASSLASITKLLHSYEADFFLVAAYGKIIPQQLLDIPRIGSINVHGSLLPKYRGASPIHGALLGGEKQTGVTIMAMDAEVDHGDKYVEHVLEIEPDECEPQLEVRLAELSALHIGNDLQHIAEGSLKPAPQDHAQATFTNIIRKEDGRIDWNRSAQDIYNQFRAYYEWPGVFTLYEGKRLKILDCQPMTHRVEAQRSKPVGSVFLDDDIILISCETGSLQLLIVQIEGKNPVAITDFLNGHPHFVGSVLDSELVT